MPAFLLSKKQISEDSTQIFSLHFDEKEFIVKDVLFLQNASSIQLKFSSISSEKDLVTCKIHFLDAQGNRNLLESYNLSDDWANYGLELPIEKQHQQIQMSIYISAKHIPRILWCHFDINFRNINDILSYLIAS